MSTRNPKAFGPRRHVAAVGALRYSTAYTLTIEALYTLSCEPGVIAERLRHIDPEFFALTPEAFPEVEGVRDNFARLKQFATRLGSTEQSSQVDLQAMAQLLWDVHRDFSHYMQSDA